MTDHLDRVAVGLAIMAVTTGVVVPSWLLLGSLMEQPKVAATLLGAAVAIGAVAYVIGWVVDASL